MAGGRPTRYNKLFAEQAYKLCLLGATDASLATFFGVVESTINLWKKTHKEFSESIKAGKDKADADIADSLKNQATGFYKEVEEVKIMRDGTEVRYKVNRYFPPQPTSTIFWLKNRQSKQWRDKQEVEHSGEVKTYHDMTDEELEAEIQKRGG